MVSYPARYLFAALGLGLLGLAVWFFRSIVAYILISAVLSLLARPVVQVLSAGSRKGFRIPVFVAAGLAVTAMWVLMFSFLILLVPLIVEKARFLAGVDPNRLYAYFTGPLQWLEDLYNRLPFQVTKGMGFRDYLNEKIVSLLNLASIGNYFGTVGKTLGNFMVAAVSVSFISFFFLKDEHLFFKGIMVFVPEKFEDRTAAVLDSVRNLLVRYFTGLLIESGVIFILTSIGLRIVGLSTPTALVLGFMAGVLNIIPYVGPMISLVVGVILGLITFAAAGVTTGFLPLSLGLVAVFLIAQFVDNMILQPLIFSSSVNAHPLEIFLVILAAGSVSGIGGMIIAIPFYTVIRVIAKEFFSKFEMVKKLTRHI